MEVVCLTIICCAVLFCVFERIRREKNKLSHYFVQTSITFIIFSSVHELKIKPKLPQYLHKRNMDRSEKIKEKLFNRFNCKAQRQRDEKQTTFHS